MICNRCGFNNIEGSNVCGGCGTPLNGGSNPAQSMMNAAQPQMNNQFARPGYNQAPMYAQQQYRQQPMYGQPMYGQAVNVRPRVSVYKPNIIGIISSVVYAIGAFVPFACRATRSEGETLLEIDDTSIIGILVILLAITTLAFSIADLNIPLIVFGSFAAFSSIVCTILLIEFLDGGFWEPEIGIFLIIFGGIALLIAGIVGTVMKVKRRNKAIQKMYQGMK